jgi:hypothetical protein
MHVGKETTQKQTKGSNILLLFVLRPSLQISAATGTGMLTPGSVFLIFLVEYSKSPFAASARWNCRNQTLQCDIHSHIY